VSYDCDNGSFILQDSSTINISAFHVKRNLLFADGRVGEYQQ
jgi:prepilin-type processing-associated H-X9-DG protein